MALRSCLVSGRDLAGTEHAVEVTAESLYEAVAQALGILRGDQWVEEIGEGLTELKGACQAARRGAPGQDEGLPAVAGVAGQDARRVRPQTEAAGVGEGGRTGAVIRSEDWPACPSGRRFPRAPGDRYP
jgi:hypothetical protein